MGNTLWVVVEFIAEMNGRSVWDMVGVFSSKDTALEICRARGDSFGLGPVELNKPFPVERVEWEGFYYPGVE